jgi:hypothetical protein
LLAVRQASARQAALSYLVLHILHRHDIRYGDSASRSVRLQLARPPQQLPPLRVAMKFIYVLRRLSLTTWPTCQWRAIIHQRMSLCPIPFTLSSLLVRNLSARCASALQSSPVVLFSGVVIHSSYATAGEETGRCRQQSAR